MKDKLAVILCIITLLMIVFTIWLSIIFEFEMMAFLACSVFMLLTAGVIYEMS